MRYPPGCNNSPTIRSGCDKSRSMHKTRRPSLPSAYDRLAPATPAPTTTTSNGRPEACEAAVEDARSPFIASFFFFMLNADRKLPIATTAGGRERCEDQIKSNQIKSNQSNVPLEKETRTKPSSACFTRVESFLARESNHRSSSTPRARLCRPQSRRRRNPANVRRVEAGEVWINYTLFTHTGLLFPGSAPRDRSMTQKSIGGFQGATVHGER